MNTEALFLFLILVLGLLLCSFLGGNYIENENFTSSFNSDFVIEQDKPKTVDFKIEQDKPKTVAVEPSNTSNKYDNYNHYTGTYTDLTNEKSGGDVKVSAESNKIPIPSSSNTSITNPFNSNYSTYNNTPSTQYGSTGVNGANINNSNKAFTENTSQPSMQRSAQPSMQRSMQQPQSSYNYSDSLPRGISKSQIPPGQEDLYILKSEIVPPVCPACPASSAVCPREEPCPPCPACARCPEPSFECKKVPNYNSINNEFLPMPVLSDFSSFGI